MSNEVAQRGNTAVAPRTKDVRELLRSESMLEQIRLSLPAHMSPDRMVRVMCTAMLRTPKLLECRQESLIEALMVCSQAGIEPDGRNAHLIPYGDKVQVIFDYKGLVAIAERNGVESIYADKVCDKDVFEAWVEEGAKKLKHKVDWKQPRGKAYAYYASCIRNGRLDYEVMTRDEVDAIRTRSRASGSGPWVTDYDEMAKKTVLRRMSKRWDLSPEARDAMVADDDVPSDIKSQSSVTVDFSPPPAPLLPTPRAKRITAPAAPAPAPAPAPATAQDDGDGDLGPSQITDKPMRQDEESRKDQAIRILTEGGVDFGDFRDLLGIKRIADLSAYGEYADVPQAEFEKLTPATIAEALKKFGQRPPQT